MNAPAIDPADLAACRASLANGSRTFLAASRVLPRGVRDAATALYAFCRVADDLVDEAGPEAIDAAVATLRARLDAIYAGTPVDAAPDRALAVVVRVHRVARAMPDALIDGFAWDAERRPIETLDDLHAYAARVAGSVGATMALLMGVRAPDALARACDLGVAMQLSNIARDVGEDARLGRLYLPRAWMREAGLDADRWLAAPAHDDALAAVVARLLAEADRLYARVGGGIAALPWSCRPGIESARRLYEAIGHAVARRGFDGVSARAVVPAPRKAWLLGAAMLGALAPERAVVAMPPLAATRFLVDAATSLDGDTALQSGAATPRRRRPRVRERVVWTIELFERLERLDRRPFVARGAADWAAGEIAS